MWREKKKSAMHRIAKVLSFPQSWANTIYLNHLHGLLCLWNGWIRRSCKYVPIPRKEGDVCLPCLPSLHSTGNSTCHNACHLTLSTFFRAARIKHRFLMPAFTVASFIASRSGSRLAVRYEIGQWMDSVRGFLSWCCHGWVTQFIHFLHLLMWQTFLSKATYKWRFSTAGDLGVRTNY